MFKWNRNQGCLIPLIPVNELNDPYAMFLQKHDGKFIDAHKSTLINVMRTAERSSPNKPFDGEYCGGITSKHNLLQGDTVRTLVNNKNLPCTITRGMTLPKGDNRTKVRPLNSGRTFVVDLRVVQAI